MECINCTAKNSLKERKENEGRCKKCNHEFVFEPAEMDSGVRITDDLFKDVIAEVSANHLLFFTPIQLYYSLERRLRSSPSQDNPIFAYLCWGTLLIIVSIWIVNWLKLDPALIVPLLVTLYTVFTIIVVAQPAISSQANRKIRQDNIKNLKILAVIIFVVGISLSIITQVFIGIIGSVCLGLITAWLRFSSKRQQSTLIDSFLVDRKDFLTWLNRWISINYRPGKILASPKISTTQVTSNPNLIAYDFDRVVVCDSPKIAQLLLKNNFHFENNCAVMAIDRYPQDIFGLIKEMLDRTPDLKVFAFHDCSPQGLKMIRHLRTEKIWFPDLAIPIICAGILPRHIMNDPEKMISQSVESIRSSQQLAPDLRNILDPAELAWLDAGFYLELESFPPQELIQILQRGINKSYQLPEIEDGDPIVMNSPNFYTVESIV
jgi:hypothetical protein